jgi:hypothetical protein
MNQRARVATKAQCVKPSEVLDALGFLYEKPH